MSLFLLVISCSDEGNPIEPTGTIYGCTNNCLSSYDENANTDDGSCEYSGNFQYDNEEGNFAGYDIYQLFEENGCFSCHGNGANSGGVTLDTYQGATSSNVIGDDCTDALSSPIIQALQPGGVMCELQGYCYENDFENFGALDNLILWISEGARE